MKNILISIIVSAITTISIWYILDNKSGEKVLDSDYYIKNYYKSSAETLVSPHSIREKMRHGETDSFILVDTRSAKDYLQEHITGSINIDSSQTKEKIITDFRKLILENPEKDIIIYCYSASCMNGRKLGAALSENDIFVKEMTVGWNEWKYFPETWNYPEELEGLNIQDYISSGLLPGKLNLPDSEKEKEGCGLKGEFEC